MLLVESAGAEMTREELKDLDERIRKRIATRGLISRPISEEEKRRFEELRQVRK